MWVYTFGGGFRLKVYGRGEGICEIISFEKETSIVLEPETLSISDVWGWGSNYFSYIVWFDWSWFYGWGWFSNWGDYGLEISCSGWVLVWALTSGCCCWTRFGWGTK